MLMTATQLLLGSLVRFCSCGILLLTVVVLGVALLVVRSRIGARLVLLLSRRVRRIGALRLVWG
jgi:hypothetical protein